MAPKLSSSYAYSMTVIQGPCWFETEDRKKCVLETGDSILILYGSSYQFQSSPDSPVVNLLDILAQNGITDFGPQNRSDTPVNMRWGEGDLRIRLFAIAFVVQDMDRNPLLGGLPPTILLRKNGGRFFPWVPIMLSFLAEEDKASSPGYTATATHLAELIFTRYIRAHAMSLPTSSAGWMRGLSDPRIGKALAVMHSNPMGDWSADNLAREVGMARSSFARRFVQLIGTPPIEYLISLRMQLAADRLIADRGSIAELSEDLGYQSERAFRHAFKTHFGVAPTIFAKKQPTLKILDK